MKKKNKQQSLVRAVVREYNTHIKREWRMASIIFSCVIIGTILIFYVPPLVIAAIIQQEETVTLENGIWYLAAFSGAWLMGELLWRVAFYFLARFEVKALERLYTYTFSVLLYKDTSFYKDRFAGSITKNTLAFARRFEGYFDTLTLGIASQVGPIIFGLVVLTFISPLLSLTLLVLLSIAFLLIKPRVLHRSKLVKNREDQHAAMSGHISDTVSNIATVQSFGAEKIEEQVHRRQTNKYVAVAQESWDYHNIRIDMLIAPFYIAANAIALAIVLASGVDATTKAALFIAFNYFMNISRFLWNFNDIYRRLEDVLTDGALFMEYATTPIKVVDATNAKKLNVHNGHISFIDMSFAHEDEERNLLFSNFSLDIKPGQRIGLVGHSGAGKSTLVNLLLRFSDVSHGSIEIDGNNIRSITQESLRKSIAYVPQEPGLFHRSLRENIAYGKPDASEEAIIRAAKLANAWEFIDKLPDRLDTMVGERGVKLSGGQRQRIAIARAILKDAPILVLDEATSALDSESEVYIQKALAELMKDRTSVVIAHRLSTIAKLDRIVVLQDGKIIEDGPHQELLSQNGVYASLWSHQSGGFIEE